MKYRKTVSLGLLILFSFIFQIFVLKSGFVTLSGDEFFRGLLSYVWYLDPYFASDAIGEGPHSVWLPLHFWIVGAALHFYYDLWLTPILTSMFFSILTLIMLYKVTEHLFNEKTAGYLAVLIASLTPWYVWLSISGMPYSLFNLFVILGIYALLKWQNNRDNYYLLLSCFAFLLSTMLRQEGWFFAFLCSLYLACYLVRHQQKVMNSKFLILCILLPCSFVLVWIGYDAISYDQLFHFVIFQKEFVKNQSGMPEALFFRALRYPFLMFIVSPVITTTAIFVLVRLGFRKQSRPDSKVLSFNSQSLNLYLYFVLGELFFLVMMAAMGTQTNAAPQRYVVLNVLLLIPLVSGWFVSFFSKERAKEISRRFSYSRIGVLILLCLVLGGQAKACYNYPAYYSDTASAGRFLNSLWEKGLLTATDTVWTEKVVRDILGYSDLSYIDKIMLSSNHAGFQILSNHPLNFSYVYKGKKIVGKKIMPDKSNLPEVLPAKDKWAFYLSQNDPKIIILKDRTLIDLVPAHLKKIAVKGEYRIFSSKLDQETELTSKTVIPRSIKRIDEKFDDTLTLVGYDEDKRVFPKYITFFWKLLKETEKNYKISLYFINTMNQNKSYSKELFLYDGAQKTGQWKNGSIVEDSVRFSLPQDMIPGKYRIMLSVKEMTRDDPVFVGAYFIVPSKTEVIKRFLKGEDISINLLLKVINTL